MFVMNDRGALRVTGNGLAIGPPVLNDQFFRGGLSMGNPKIAIVAYCLAVGFILAVALHSQAKTLATADILAERAAAPTKMDRVAPSAGL